MVKISEPEIAVGKDLSAKNLSSMERLKAASRYPRCNLAQDMAEAHTAGVGEDSAQLLKFHGMCLQDNRDLRPERMKKKLEKAFGFMINTRLRVGVVVRTVNSLDFHADTRARAGRAAE